MLVTQQMYLKIKTFSSTFGGVCVHGDRHHPIETRLMYEVHSYAQQSIKEMDSVLPDGTTCRLDYQGGTFLGSIMTTLVDSDLCLSEKATVVQYAGSLDGRGALFATQVSARKAEATFGAAGTAAIETEVSSLLRKKVFSAVVSSSLSREQRKELFVCHVSSETRLMQKETYSR